jgi:hypothetical protein
MSRLIILVVALLVVGCLAFYAIKLVLIIIASLVIGALLSGVYRGLSRD